MDENIEPFDLMTLVKADTTLQRRMYFSYLIYFQKKGIKANDLMTFDEWRKHFGLDEDG